MSQITELASAAITASDARQGNIAKHAASGAWQSELARRAGEARLAERAAADSASTAFAIGDDGAIPILAWLTAAQRGNVSLHSRDPFMGAGQSELQWSMAVLLQGAAVRDGGRHGEERFIRGAFDPRTISAAQLQHLLRASLLRLHDPALPPHQRVPGVHLLDRIVADG